MLSNYEKQALSARALFLDYEQDKMIRKYDLKTDGSYLYLSFLGETYRISRESGAVEREEKGIARLKRNAAAGKKIGESGLERNAETRKAAVQEENGTEKKEEQEIAEGAVRYRPCVEYQTVMTLYDILCFSREQPVLSGEWCRLASLQRTNSNPSDERLTRHIVEKFSGRTKQLRRACEALGGVRRQVPASADACYQIPVFPFFPIVFQFWDGDEEFAPKAVLLWDKNALDFMHFETLYYVMNLVLERLLRLMENSSFNDRVQLPLRKTP